ncbi:glycoside hydrolase, partial [Tothia fuscella]
VVPIPTPLVTVCPTPGTYEFPAVTVKINNTITVVAARTTPLTPGPNTWGGYTVTVNGSSTVTCPYVQIQTSGTVVTSVVKETTYVCPSAGVYTPIEPTSTTASVSTVLVYPVPTTYTPDVYTAPATTVTATVSDYVYVCPLETATRSTTAVATTTAAPIVPAKISVQAYSAPAKPSVQEFSAPAKPSVQASSPSATPSKAPSSSPDIKVNGKKWAMTYTPYTKAGLCKTASEVDSDISLIASKGFTTVRLYATDCFGLTNVGASCKAHGLKLIMGVFIKADGIDGARPQIGEIANWGKQGNWDLIVMLVVGNEALFNNYCSASQLAGFISEAKSTWSAAGYKGPVTTTEPLDKLQASGGELCGVIDVIGANIQPFFNGGINAASAGTFVKGQLDLAAKVCPGKTAYNLECGWPNGGNANSASVPGASQQAAAIADIIDKVGEHTVIFSFDNDAWKHPGEFGVEQYFGCSNLF